MNQKTKWVVGCVGLVVLIGGAGLLYNNLSASYKLGANSASTSSVVASTAESTSSETDTSSAASQASETPESSTPEKIKAPDFTMEDAEGNKVKLSEFVGKPVVLNFWATWCGYCAVEMPDFDKVNAELGGEVQFIMLDVVDGVRETKEKGMAFIEEKGYTFPVYYDTDMEGGNAYGVRSLPTTWFIDKNGYLATYMPGAMDEESLRQGIETAIAQGEQ